MNLLYKPLLQALQEDENCYPKKKTETKMSCDYLCKTFFLPICHPNLETQKTQNHHTECRSIYHLVTFRKKALQYYTSVQSQYPFLLPSAQLNWTKVSELPFNCEVYFLLTILARDKYFKFVGLVGFLNKARRKM